MATYADVLRHRHFRIPIFIAVLSAMAPGSAGVDLGISYSTGILQKLGLSNAALMTVCVVHLPTLFFSAAGTLFIVHFAKSKLFMYFLLT